jgi:hypothetical protein
MEWPYRVQMMKKQKPVLPHYNMLYMRSFVCIPLLLRYHLTFPKKVFETLWCCFLPNCGFIIFLEFWNVDLQNVADFLFDCQKWGLDLTQPDAPNPATTKYTDFLLQTASECVDRASGTRDGELLKVTESNAEQRLHRCARTITAMTPCMRLYAFLGQELERHTGMGCKHPYQEWIETYSSVDFEVFLSCLLLRTVS